MSEIGVHLHGRGMIPDEWFERAERIPMTKGVVRSLIISLMTPLDGANVIEIGSGTGAMTVELARAVGENGRVASVEISPLAAGLTRGNVERAGLGGRVVLVEGRAPRHIPMEMFGAAFIGGHGEELESIMGTCLDRMDPGGRLVLTSITPRTTSRALAYLESMGVGVGFWRIHSSVARKIDSEWLLMGDNPVDIIWGDK